MRVRVCARVCVRARVCVCVRVRVRARARARARVRARARARARAPGPGPTDVGPMSYELVLCPIAYVPCPMSYVLCPMSYGPSNSPYAQGGTLLPFPGFEAVSVRVPCYNQCPPPQRRGIQFGLASQAADRPGESEHR